MNQPILQTTPELKIAICEDNPAHLSHNHEILRQNPGDARPVFSLYTSGKELLSDMEKGKIHLRLHRLPGIFQQNQLK